MIDRSASPIDGPVLLAGATGTIGRSVADRLIEDGRDLVCLMRPKGARLDLAGAKFCNADLADGRAVSSVFAKVRPACVISCIASRSGAPKDAWAADYAANCALLEAAEEAGVSHFILLSAICVQKPRLAFQHAKLAFEAKLAASAVDHTVVRPTAFFKSLSGQIERVRSGRPFMVFGDGTQTRCKPISDTDCGRFIADCVSDPERRGAILPIGGPGPAITMREQGAMLFELTGQEPRYRSVPVGMFDAAAAVLGLGSGLSDWCAEKAEYARIAKYYATESMLVWDAASGAYSAEKTPEFGSDTLRDHYARSLSGLLSDRSQTA